ncbi:MAG: PAS domain S-box protein [Gammaproteobacteria bacterium]|nr:PAS domain S-box protein [Gammaproteobacteria bacterium]
MNANRRHLEEQRINSGVEENYTLSDISFEALVIHENGKILEANNAVKQAFGYTPSEVIGNRVLMLIAEDSLGTVSEKLHQENLGPYTVTGIKKDGSVFPLEIVQKAVPGKGSAARAMALRDVGKREQMNKALMECQRQYRTLLDTIPSGIQEHDEHGVIVYGNAAYHKMLGYSNGELHGKAIWDMQPSNSEREEMRTHLAALVKKMPSPFPFLGKRRTKNGKIIDVEVTWNYKWSYSGKVTGFISLITDISKRKRTTEALRKERDRAQNYLDIAGVMIVAMDAEQRVTMINRKGCEILECRKEMVKGQNWFDNYIPSANRACEKTAFIQAMRKEVTLPEYSESRVLTWHGEERIIAWHHVVTMDDKGRITGTLNSGENITERKRAEEQLQHQLERLTAIRDIALSISSCADLPATLDILLKQIIRLLRVDAAIVLLFNSRTRRLEFGATHGTKLDAMDCPPKRLGESYAGRAALERRVISLSSMKHRNNCVCYPRLMEEGFTTYYGVPLMAKGEVKGVLELFHRLPLEPEPAWLELLESLATQAAIAVDNASLFNDLEHSNIELAQAYDATLEGWAHALDLRDKETENHARRVAEMSERLGRTMGVSEENLVHLHRGALLHDIGKMGIPDRILQKPGPLTDEEWEIMRRHPVYAHEMLSPIAYLRPALDIPYCHHERWDGTGYPQGLKGEAIPLGARIFSVVDVWDALYFERVYRAAWPIEKVIAFLREEAGKLFDPDVVHAFVHLLDES